MRQRVFAPAKINLTLEVGRPGADGYHPLQSTVMFAGVGDWIEAAPAEQISLTICGPFAEELQADKDNLVLRAARLFDSERGAAIRLEKHLPIASGIGGGSADAAATLLALNELWTLGWRTEDLVRMAVQLGADVPVCVRRHSAWVTGAGEAVAARRTPILHAVLVNSGNPLPTPAVYRRFDELRLGADFERREAGDWADWREAVGEVMLYGNDLEPSAVSLMPELGVLLDSLRGDPRSLCAGMSGSGATCFALTHGAAEAAALAADLSASNPDFWVRATTLGAS
jgi:4-diphosphocytidyl-2-C-methyl-D-erythritol kinase